MNTAEELLDGVIQEDVQNEWFDIYCRETGLDPVPEEGGHTDEYENWIVSTVNAMWESGVRSIAELRKKMAQRASDFA